MTIWAIVPLKPLRDGKSRLAHILSADERAQLTTEILKRTLRVLEDTAAIYRSLVISRDPAVLKIARAEGAFTFGEGEKLGLNAALTRASHVAAAQGASSILILPADLPFLSTGDVATILSSAGTHGGGVNGNSSGYLPSRIAHISPDRQNDGTNALYISPPLGFKFHYGPQSFQRHLEEAEHLGISCRVVHTPGVKFDIDSEEDWRTYMAMQGQESPAV